MNLVGKIFVGVIALMSVVCLTVSALSYASHHNWKEQTGKLKAQLDESQKQVKLLEEQKAELNNKIATESVTYSSTIQALKTKADDLEKSNKQLADENVQLQNDLDARLAVINTNNEQIKNVNKELEEASKNLADAQVTRSSYLKKLSETVQALHDAQAKNGDLADQNADLTKLYDDAVAILSKNGMSTDLADYGETPVSAVRGSIQDIRKDDNGFMLISIGSDDGLAENHKLDVRRGDSYLGKIQVVSVEPDSAICKVLPEFRQGVMMEGDEVYAQQAN